jgi:hypothetical protein
MARVPVVALALFATAAGAAAQLGPGGGGPFPNAAPPLLLKLEGVVQANEAAAKRTGYTAISFAFLDGKGGTERWLGVTKARTVGGDQPLNGGDVLAAVAPFTPNFLVVGPESVVAQLREMPPGTAVRIAGLVNRGSRTYFLRRVERDVPGAG